MTPQERHAKAIIKLRDAIKGIPGVDYSTEKILPIVTLSGDEYLGGLQYHFLGKGRNFVLSVEHVGGVMFEVGVYRFHRLKGLSKFNGHERVAFASLRGRVKAVADWTSSYF